MNDVQAAQITSLILGFTALCPPACATQSLLFTGSRVELHFNVAVLLALYYVDQRNASAGSTIDPWPNGAPPSVVDLDEHIFRRCKCRI